MSCNLSPVLSPGQLLVTVGTFQIAANAETWSERQVFVLVEIQGANLSTPVVTVTSSSSFDTTLNFGLRDLQVRRP